VSASITVAQGVYKRHDASRLLANVALRVTGSRPFGTCSVRTRRSSPASGVQAVRAAGSVPAGGAPTTPDPGFARGLHESELATRTLAQEFPGAGLSKLGQTCPDVALLRVCSAVAQFDHKDAQPL